MKPLSKIISILLAAAPLAALSQTSEPAKTLDKVEVTGVREKLEQAGRLSSAIEKTEVINSEQIERKQAGNLAQVIESEPGIRVNNECSMCGIKRVMINGLKGEQTTILVDGVPMHSVVSSYYGIDAITSAGIERVEIARGPGAALATPEAIGGAVNIISERVRENNFRFDLSAGNDGYERYNVVAGLINESGSAWASFAMQYDDIHRVDRDSNGVTESPDLSNKSFTAKFSADISENDNLQLRFATYRSDVFGGPTGVSKGEVIASFSQPASLPLALFVGGDVRNRFTGAPYETAEFIDTKRSETTLRWIKVFANQASFELIGSTVSNSQDSSYEGFDYVNDDDSLWLDAKFTVPFGDKHLLSFGVSQHSEELRSQSNALEALQLLDPTIAGDSFDYKMKGIYVQDIWNVTDKTELSLAVRFDKIKADFIDQPGKDQIDASVFAPRALLKYAHSDVLTSRFSAGRGYRAPLSFFESDHGLLDNGYEVALNDLEKSWQFGYSLGYETPTTAITGSVNFSAIENIAYIDGSGPRPVLRNLDRDVQVNTYDISGSHQFTEHLNLGASVEYFDYSKDYQGTFSIPPVEERARIFMDWDGHGWDVYAALNWIGARDLAKYGGSNRYNIFNDANNDGIVDPGELQDLKSTKAPAYFTVDARVERKINDKWSVYLGGNNLTDYTQAGDEESPLFWDADGGYDVIHIYGPLRGRSWYLGLQARF